MNPTDFAISDRRATAMNLMSPTDTTIPDRRATAMDIIGIEGRSTNKVELYSGEIAAQGEDAEESIRASRNQAELEYQYMFMTRRCRRRPRSASIALHTCRTDHGVSTVWEDDEEEEEEEEETRGSTRSRRETKVQSQRPTWTMAS